MKSIVCLVSALLTAITLNFSSSTHAEETFKLLIIRTTQKSSVDIVAAIKAYTEGKKWLYLGDNKIKNGEVILVKVCIPSVSKYVWAAGMEYSAMLPCGNLSIYMKDGATQISLLDPGYMHMLHPDPNLKKLGNETRPLFEAMLNSVTK